MDLETKNGGHTGTDYITNFDLAYLRGEKVSRGVYKFKTAYGDENPALLKNGIRGTTIAVSTTPEIEEVAGVKPGDFVTYETEGENGKHGATVRIVGFASTSGRTVSEVGDSQIEVWGVEVGQVIKGISMGLVKSAMNMGNINDWKDGRGKVSISHEDPNNRSETGKAVVNVLARQSNTA